MRRDSSHRPSPLVFVAGALLLAALAGSQLAADPLPPLRSGETPPERPEPRRPPRPPAKSLRVLFIGNSLTEANDLPLMVEALAKSDGRRLSVSAVTFGGFDLSDHWNNGSALEAIRGQTWDVVVLQQGPSSLPASRVHLRSWTQRWASEIARQKGRTALFMVWPGLDRLPFFDAVRDSYALAAADVKGIFLPAGEALRAAARSVPTSSLYAADGFHPTALGSYCAALSIYGILLQRDPRLLTTHLTLANGARVDVPAALADPLRAAAAEANRRYGVPPQP